MKTKENILTMIILTLVLGCGKSPNQDKKTHIEKDSIQMIEPKDKVAIKT